MAVLRQAGLIDSVRGRSGGYRLAKAPEEIGLGSLLLVLGEPLFDEPSYCQKHAGIAEDGICVHHGGCSLASAVADAGTVDARQPRPDHPRRPASQARARITELLRARLSHTIFADNLPLISLTPLVR